MRFEALEVEAGLLREGFVHIAEEVDGQQTARVVGAEGNLAAGVGRDRHEALVGIAVGDALADNRIPEEHAGFGRLPGVVDNLLPQLAGVDILLVERRGRINRELLVVGLALDGGTHELVVDFDGDVGARHLARVDLGVDEALGVGVLDGERQHQRTTAAVLRHLARRVGVALHEGDDTRRGERRVENRAARGTDVREVVTHAAATLHELHLLLVDAEDAAVAVGRMLVADDEAVRERSHLQVVADAGHRAALGNHVAEVVEQFENLLLRHGVGILPLDALDFGGDALVHLAGGRFVDIAERILQRILAHPHRGGQFVPVEVFFRFGNRIVVGNFLQRCGCFGF